MAEIIRFDKYKRRKTGSVQGRIAAQGAQAVFESIDFSQLSMLVAFHEDGRIVHWTSFTTQQQYDWAKKAFGIALDGIKK